jgi:hypothetical protein
MIDSIVERFGGTPRSPKWQSVRNEFIKTHDECVCCGSKNKLQVHHILPFCVDPSKELDPDNLATMCSRCHLLIGHCGWFQRYNPDLHNSVQFIKTMLKARRGCSFGSVSPPSWMTQIIQSILRRWYHF